MVAALVLAVGIASAHAVSTHRSSKTTASKSKSSKSAHSSSSRRRGRKGAWKRKGQQKIDETRTRQIQEALIREKYLDGEPTGNWDARTEQAMVRYQSDNGWQSKITPDSRALIKLGLGPDHSQDAVVIPERKSAPQATESPITAVTGPKR
jgi:peptidoglycan hydrolase-like protein with peptidoglycan-binding domain